MMSRPTVWAAAVCAVVLVGTGWVAAAIPALAQGAAARGGGLAAAESRPVADEPAVAEVPAPKPVLVAPPKVVPEATGGGRNSQALALIRSQSADRDLEDNVDRVLVLTPGGPLVLQLSIFLDERPFRAAREALIDDMLKRADADKDGMPGWNEALGNPRFLPSRGAGLSAAQREQQRNYLIPRYDADGDGRVDRREARALLRDFGGGAEFQVSSFFSGGLRPELLTLLDLDRDGALSREEIALAPERLRARDANGNEILEANEADRTFVGDVSRTSNVLPLGAGMNAAAIRSALRGRYGRERKIVAEGMPLFPHLMEGLDRNANGELDEDEVAGFNTIRPHLALTVRLTTPPPTVGTPTIGALDEPARVAVTFASPEFTERPADERAGPTAQVGMPGLRMTLSSSGVSRNVGGFGRQGEALVARYDLDKNGYLERKEFEGLPGQEALISQFEAWDDDGDGKVYPKEIESYYEMQMAPRATQVHVSGAEIGTSLFAALDQSGDGRLSARETLTAAKRLATLDANGDGALSGAEIAREIRIRIAMGGQGYGFGGGFVQADGRVVGGGAARPSTAGPKWFVHMDRNGDGDVTLREFLGTPEQFQSLDRNGDGFIEPSEAAAAEVRKSPE